MPVICLCILKGAFKTLFNTESGFMFCWLFFGKISLNK
ncbi:hypothetical Protein YC6258_03058 [Gynuella sunshinyii YC6258]|uniref:Uncharacterized protein n=1 Tax=Gynuella sunshinyii YC6258 TaxID=1445510 RepID=A0A0C5VXD3_9GAMM|nr:hypothetical Protein YC6258_03058 [Gynuella sunshinyii YC6258]